MTRSNVTIATIGTIWDLHSLSKKISLLLLMLLLPRLTNPEWYLDSGATHHVIDNAENVNNWEW